jgi:hypothetical protein
LKSASSTFQIGRDRKKTCFSSPIELLLLQRQVLDLGPLCQVGFLWESAGWRSHLQGAAAASVLGTASPSGWVVAPAGSPAPEGEEKWKDPMLSED